MKKFITYSYTILLLLTCLIAFPYALKEITGNESNPIVAAFKNFNNDSNENTPIESEQVQTNNEDIEEEAKTPSETSESSPEETTNNEDDDKESYEFTTVANDY